MESVDGLPGLALHNETPGTPAELLDPQTLEKRYESALQLLFAVAVAAKIENESAEAVPITRGVLTKGFTVNIPWARTLQGGLAAVAVMVVVLATLNLQRPCKLDGEPNSLAAALRLLSVSREMSADMNNAELHVTKELLKLFEGRGKRYKLELGQGQGPRVETVDVDEIRATLAVPNDETLNRRKDKELWQLRTRTGLGLIVLLGVVSTLLAVVFWYSRRYNGLSTFALANSFGYKVLFSYIPILIGTGVEPILVTIGSCYCMLGPYKPLTKRHAYSSKSLTVDFDRSPPHFQVFPAFSAGNIALGTLAVAILLSNILAVAFTGLFLLMSAELHTKMDMKTPAALTIKGFTEPSVEMYYLLSGQRSGHLIAPSWTTQEYYVVPFTPADLDTFQYEGPTLGIGADIQCNIVSVNTTTLTLKDSYGTNLGVNDTCWNATMDIYLDSTSSQAYARPSVDCPARFFIAWVNWTLDTGEFYLSEGEQTNVSVDNSKIVILNCSSVERVVELTATVNATHHVLSTTKRRALDAQEIAGLYATNTSITDRLVPTFNSLLREYDLDIPGEKMLWLDYAISTTELIIAWNTTSIFSLPDTTHLATALEDVYRQLFVFNILYADDILSIDKYHTVPGTAIVQMKRVRVSGTMFTIAMAILLYTVVVLVLLYLGQERQVLSHMPKSLARMYTSLYASNAKEECGEVSGRNPGERAKELNKRKGRYSYGWFKSGDGKFHFGVYREEDEMEDGLMGNIE